MSTADVLKKGTLLVIETGEYSDRTWYGPVRLLKAASRQQMADAFKSSWKKGPDDWGDTPDPSDFLPWLVSENWVEHVDNVYAWHVGSYGQFDPC